MNYENHFLSWVQISNLYVPPGQHICATKGVYRVLIAQLPSFYNRCDYPRNLG